MKGRNRVRALAGALLALMVGVSPVSAGGQLAKEIARAYGIDAFPKIETIRFTFHAKRGGKTVDRVWVWEPASGRVTYRGKNREGKLIEFSYNHKDLKAGDAAEVAEVDPMFINDQYWLLFPFHLVWDSNLSIKEDGKKPLPMSKGWADHLIAEYTGNAGYTPGDVFELYVGPDHRIEQWIYRRGGAKKPSLIASWTDNTSCGPITVSLTHVSADRSTKVWFTDVAVKLAGGADWVSARPVQADSTK